MKKKKDIVKIGLIILIGISITCLLLVYKQVFTDILVLIIIISYLIFSVGFLGNRIKLSFIGYFIMLLSILFIRDKVDNRISETSYIWDWLKIVFQNKIVFINIFGNLILYIPLYLYLVVAMKVYTHIKFKQLLSFIIVTSFIIICELLQYLFGIGVFDIIDILINVIGILIGVIGYEVFNGQKRKETEKVKEKIQIER